MLDARVDLPMARRTNWPVQLWELLRCEEQLGSRLPSPYREWMLTSNGFGLFPIEVPGELVAQLPFGRVSRCGLQRVVALREILPLVDPLGAGKSSLAVWERWRKADSQSFDRGLLPIAELATNIYLLLELVERGRGGIVIASILGDEWWFCEPDHRLYNSSPRVPWPEASLGHLFDKPNWIDRPDGGPVDLHPWKLHIQQNDARGFLEEYTTRHRDLAARRHMIGEVVRDGSVEMLRVLLQSGVTIDEILDQAYHDNVAVWNVIKSSPDGLVWPFWLSSACGMYRSADAVTQALAAGLPINTKVYRGFETPLHLAVFAGNAEAVRLLLKAGADRRARDGRLKYASDYVPGHPNERELRDALAQQ